jgi:hypothetical protein
MTALKIKSLLGVNYQNFSIIGFVRHPYGRIVSSYFFYKKGGKEAWQGKQEQRSLGDNLKDILFKSRITLKNEISHENKSNHGYEDEYFKNPVFKWLINRKVKRDLEFYNLVLSSKQ